MAEPATAGPQPAEPPAAAEAPSQILVEDLSHEVPADTTLHRIERRPFDPEPQRERMRGWLAGGLLGMLAMVLFFSFVSLWAKIGKEELQTVLTIVVGPLVALVSAATGFYFGSNANPRP